MKYATLCDIPIKHKFLYVYIGEYFCAQNTGNKFYRHYFLAIIIQGIAWHKKRFRQIEQNINNFVFSFDFLPLKICNQNNLKNGVWI